MSDATGPRSPEFPLLSFSIIIPCFNAAQFITKTLLSIKKQAYPKVEVIVVDGASTDDTVELARSFEGLSVRLLSEPDKGQLDALQKGLKLASGDICYWLNADDILMPNALRTVSRLFAEDPGLDLVFSDDFAFDEAKRTLSVGATIRNFTYYEHILFYRQMYSECIFWRGSKTRYLAASYLDLRLCTDFAFFANLRFGLKERWVKKRLGAFRIAANQASQRYTGRLAEEREFIRNLAYSRHGWSPLQVFLRRVLIAPRFFVLQVLYPRLQRAFRKLFRVLSGDRRRRSMEQMFFSSWLNDARAFEDSDLGLLDR
jgi:glycosyltransferase involved in cell wall biosynthesis